MSWTSTFFPEGWVYLGNGNLDWILFGLKVAGCLQLLHIRKKNQANSCNSCAMMILP